MHTIISLGQSRKIPTTSTPVEPFHSSQRHNLKTTSVTFSRPKYSYQKQKKKLQITARKDLYKKILSDSRVTRERIKMPDLGQGGNLSLSSSLTLTRCPALKPNSPLPPPPDAIDQSDSITSTTATITSVTVKTLVKWDQSVPEGAADLCNGSSIRVLKRTSASRLGCKKGFNNNISSNNGKCLDDYVRVWVQKKMDAGVSQSRCLLPFLVGAKKMVDFFETFFFLWS